MKTNRDDVRLKWDAEETFKRLNDKRRCHAVEPHEYIGEYTVPYTPPSNIAPMSLRHSEPVKKPGRDYEALTKAALRKPRTDNDALVEKYGGGEKALVGGDAVTRTPAAPIPDGARGDVWPKWSTITGDNLYRHDEGFVITGYAKDGRVLYPSRTGHKTHCIYSYERDVPHSEALAWLDANGHKAYADSLRQPRKQVEGRVWKMNGTQSQGSVVSHWANIGGVSYWREYNGSWNKYALESGSRLTLASCLDELHGPEADAIIRECAKAMGLE